MALARWARSSAARFLRQCRPLGDASGVRVISSSPLLPASAAPEADASAPSSLQISSPETAVVGKTEVQDGDIGIISGTPGEVLKRKVIIYRPARSATQQGGSKTEKWRLRFYSVQKWENPLMGWISTADPVAMVADAALSFATDSAAIEFARKHGWEYEVEKPHDPIRKPKAYADNFKWKGPPEAPPE